MCKHCWQHHFMYINLKSILFNCQAHDFATHFLKIVMTIKLNYINVDWKWTKREHTKKFYHLKIWMTFWVCFYQKKFSHLCPLQNHDLKVKLRNFQSAIQKFLFPKMVLYYIYCKMYTLMQLVYNSIRYKALSIILLMHKA